MKSINSTNTLRVVFLLILTVSFVLFVKQNNQRKQVHLCKHVSKTQALSIIRNLPEIKSYLKNGKTITKDQTSEATIDVDSETPSLYTIHVYSNEQYPNDPEIGHAATFNWYTVDKCTGEIKCSFTVYDNKGRYVKNNDDYPCD